jgi:hypothetical protein
MGRAARNLQNLQEKTAQHCATFCVFRGSRDYGKETFVARWRRVYRVPEIALNSAYRIASQAGVRWVRWSPDL